MTNRTHFILIGTSPAIVKIRREAELVARVDATVLIEGETGCGKEVVAGLIHQLSQRNGKFVAVNVAAIPDTMFEGEMFGHRRGAFTGANYDRIGHVKESHRGTLFLDEISSLPVSAQVKLLRVLETGHIRPLGATGEEPVNLRVVAASNSELSSEAHAGRFRSDLLHRLCDWRIYLPPLRERPEDIEPLAMHFLRELDGPCRAPQLTATAIRLLSEQRWPGNVRELRQTVRRASYIAEGQEILPSTIALALAHGTPPLGVAAVKRTVSDHRIEGFVKLLETVNWDTIVAATRLGVTRKTIYARLQKYGLEIPDKYQRRASATPCDVVAE